MIQGLRTAIYPTPDLARCKEWYRQVIERDPYFDEPFYVGFSAGGFGGGVNSRWRARHRRSAGVLGGPSFRG
jgi:hypothetical protein